MEQQPPGFNGPNSKGWCVGQHAADGAADDEMTTNIVMMIERRVREFGREFTASLVVGGSVSFMRQAIAFI